LIAANALLAGQKQVRHSALAQFKIGEVDRFAAVSTQTELALAEIAQSNAWIAAQQAWGRIEDALQRPLSATLPAVAETNPREENKP